METTRYDCIVLGSGIAGITAAIYLKRSAKNVLLLDKGAPGGKLNNIHRIDNYPGLSMVSGPEFAMKLVEQAMALGLSFDYGDVKDVRKNEDGDFVVTTDIEPYVATTVIVATGVNPKKLSIDGEERFAGRGVSYCATCDGNFFKGQDMVVYGYQDHALEDAIYLSGLAKKLTLLCPKPIEGLETHIQELQSAENVTVVEGATLTAIQGENKVTGVTYRHEDNEENVPCAGVFLLSGEESSSAFLSPLRPEQEKGFLVVNPLSMETSIPGLYAAGDIVAKKLRQLVNAGGEGAVAATSCIAYINAQRLKKQ